MIEWMKVGDTIEASERLKWSARLDMVHEAEVASHRRYA
jgi:hypothetical protein